MRREPFMISWNSITLHSVRCRIFYSVIYCLLWKWASALTLFCREYLIFYEMKILHFVVGWSINSVQPTFWEAPKCVWLPVGNWKVLLLLFRFSAKNGKSNLRLRAYFSCEWLLMVAFFHDSAPIFLHFPRREKLFPLPGNPKVQKRLHVISCPWLFQRFREKFLTRRLC